MSLTLSYTESESNFKPIEAGNHIARCVQIIDLGTQQETAFESTEINFNHKIRITWELPNELIEWEDKETKEQKTRPQLISQEFKASLHEKAKLRKTLASWRGRDFTDEELGGFDITKLLDVPCMINVIHTDKDGKKYANISAITPLGKGMQCPTRLSDLIHFEIENFDQNIFDSLPKFLQEKIDKSEERSIKIDDLDYSKVITDLPNPETVVNEMTETAENLGIDLTEISTPF